MGALGRRCAALATVALALGVGATAGAQTAQVPCRIFVRAGFVPAGGAAADGLSPETAFATLAQGLAAIGNAGDVVCAGPGVYREGNLDAARNGVANFPVEIRVDGRGEARIEPPDASVTTAFLLRGRRHMVIRGFFISGFSDAGIQVRARFVTGGGVVHSSGISIFDTVVSDCRVGIDVTAEDAVVIEGVRIFASTSSGMVLQSCAESPPPDVGVPGARCEFGAGAPLAAVVSNSRIGGSGADGLFIRGVEGAVVQNNVIFANGLGAARGVGISLRASPDVLLANNLVYANSEDGIRIGAADLASPNAWIVNNTIFANGSFGLEIGSSGAGSPGAVVLNNIVFDNADRTRGIGALRNSTCGYVSGFNVIADEPGEATPMNDFDVVGIDPLSFYGDVAGADGFLGVSTEPLIDRSADDDFHLPAGNPAIDAGASSVAALGLTGTAQSGMAMDQGQVDIGFHYGARADQVLAPALPYMPLFVRAARGDDGFDGRVPARALATIGAAAQRAFAGVTVVVGPGEYHECNVSPPRQGGRATFSADAAGNSTDDDPGAALVEVADCVDPNGPETGFDVRDTCDVTIEGFHVRGAVSEGIRVRNGAERVVLQHNVLFANRLGVNVTDAPGVRVFDNLVVNNRGALRPDGTFPGGGIQIGGDQAGSPDAVLWNNTCYGNANNAIQIGTSGAPSPGANIRYNVIAGNDRQGIQIGNGTVSAIHLPGLQVGFNLNNDGYTNVSRPDSDLVVAIDDAMLFVDVAAFAPAADADWRGDDSFRLLPESRALDRGDVSAAEVGLGGRSTTADGAADAGALDLGYHYPLESDGPCADLVADCNGDGRVTVNELIRAVAISLGEQDLEVCPSADANGDGLVDISELIRAVGDAQTCVG